MVEFWFGLLFIGVVAWMMLLLRNTRGIRRRYKALEAKYYALLRDHNALKDRYDQSFEMGKQSAYKEMKEEIKKTINEVKKND